MARRLRKKTRRFLAAFLLLLVSVWALCQVPAVAKYLRVEASRRLLPMLAAWDDWNLKLDPAEEFTRPPVVADPRPLKVQAREMISALRARHLLHDDKLFTIITPPAELGDACLWQGVYAAWAALHYRLEPTVENRRYAENALDGLALLASKGQPIARSILPLSVSAEMGGRKYNSDQDWQWKEDASIDSAAGWVFGCVTAYHYLPSRRRQAEGLLRDFAETLLDNGMVLRNSDGSRTRFSGMGGAIINSPTGVLSTLAVLRTLESVPDGGPYGRAHDELVAEGLDRWAAYASAPLLSQNMTNNHNIAHLAMASMLLAERDPKSWRMYAMGMVHLDQLTRKMGNSFWIYLAHWALEQRPALLKKIEHDPGFAPYAADWKRRRKDAKTSMLEWKFPECKVKRKTRNSARQDIRFVRWPITRRRLPAQPLPVWQRPPADFVWQRSAYAMDDFRSYDREPPQSFAPIDFLIAYTLGRLTGAIAPGQ